MDIPLPKLKAAVGNHGLRAGRNGQFKKGLVPWNKDLKGTHFSQETEFTKGHKPANTVEEGFISIRIDKSHKPYKWIKTANGMKPLHQINYIERYGPIPKGCIIRFKDGDTLNPDAENLIAVTRLQHMKMNQNHQKATESLRVLYKRERIRKLCDLPPLSKHHKRLVNY